MTLHNKQWRAMLLAQVAARRVVGWSMQKTMMSQLVAGALMMAIWRRGQPRVLLHHPDQGSQYISEHFRKLL